MTEGVGSDLTREKLLLESGRAEYLSQEGTNNELSVKAGSIFLLIIAISGIGISYIKDPASWVMITILSMQITGGILLACIVWPRSWRRPFDLNSVEETLYDYQPEKIMLALGKGYASTVAKNRKILGARALFLTLMSFVGIIMSIFLAIVIADQELSIFKTIQTVFSR